MKDKGGTVTMIFMFGWAAGGFIFGILGDRLGRTKTMIITILIYAVFTGASGLVNNWQLYAIARFFTGLGVGGEWAAGAALVAETFPQRARPMALGLLQALSSVGNMMAAVITFVITSANFDWRVVYFVGAAPALLVLWIRRSVHEPEQWVHAKERASVGKEMGKIGELFTHPELRRRLISSVLLCTAGVAALWGVGFFSTDFVLTELERGGVDPKSRGQIKDVMFFLQNLGSFFGIYTFAIIAEKLNRRKAFFISYALAWISILVFFWAIADTGRGSESPRPLPGAPPGLLHADAVLGIHDLFPRALPDPPPHDRMRLRLQRVARPRRRSPQDAFLAGRIDGDLRGRRAGQERIRAGGVDRRVHLPDRIPGHLARPRDQRHAPARGQGLRSAPGPGSLRLAVAGPAAAVNRREFLGASIGALAVAAARPQDAEPVVDIHQHTDYGGKRDKTGKIVVPGRSNEDLIAHQRVLGATRTILLPAGRDAVRASTHDGASNGLLSTCSGNDACRKLAKEHPDKFLFGANEVPDLPDAVETIEKELKAGAVVIGEQKFGVACDSAEMQKLYALAEQYGSPS